MNMDNRYIQRRLAVSRLLGWTMKCKIKISNPPVYTVIFSCKGKETVKVQHTNQEMAIINALNIIEGVN